MNNQQCDITGVGLRISPSELPEPLHDISHDNDIGQIVLGGGCFWCTEAVYRQLEGVSAVVSGYAGGSAADADYRSVCSGRTDHAEVIRITYDPAKTSFGTVLRVFFSVAHDPTQKDRQGADVGRQYRSAIFYADSYQQQAAKAYIEQLDGAGVFYAPICTTLEPLQQFFPAEQYHQNYAALNPDQPYIRAISSPKVSKFKNFLPNLLKRSP